MNFASFGASDACVDTFLCQQKSDDLVSEFIETSHLMAELFGQNVHATCLHNAVARSITGVMDVDASTTFTLDGQGNDCNY